MGYRLHSQTKHEIKYGAHSGLNRCSDFVNTLIGDNTNAWFNDSDYVGSATEIEVEKEEFANLIKSLENGTITDEDLSSYHLPFGEEYNVSEMRQRLITLFKGFLEDAKETDMVYLSWF